jgi:hypothetical protein
MRYSNAGGCFVPPYSSPPGSVDRTAPDPAAAPGGVVRSHRDRRTRFDVPPCTSDPSPLHAKRTPLWWPFRRHEPPVRPPPWRGGRRDARRRAHGCGGDAPKTPRRRRPPGRRAWTRHPAAMANTAVPPTRGRWWAHARHVRLRSDLRTRHGARHEAGGRSAPSPCTPWMSERRPPPVSAHRRRCWGG